MKLRMGYFHGSTLIDTLSAAFFIVWFCQAVLGVASW